MVFFIRKIDFNGELRGPAKKMNRNKIAEGEISFLYQAISIFLMAFLFEISTTKVLTKFSNKNSLGTFPALLPDFFFSRPSSLPAERTELLKNSIIQLVK